MSKQTRLIVARHRARLYCGMLPTFAEVNDKQNGFTREDLELLLHETDQLLPISADELRMAMAVQLRVYHRRYADAITGRKQGERDRTDKLVAELTRGWERYRIHAPPIGVRGTSPLQDWVEDTLGSEGVSPHNPKREA